MTNVRLGTEADWDDLVPLCIQFHQANGMAPLDLEVLRENVIRSAKQNLLLIAENDDGEAVGLLPLVQCRYSYSREHYLNDVLFYVKPGVSGVGKELMAAAREIAETLGEIAVLSVVNSKRTHGRIAAIFGWAPIGYVVRLKTRGAHDGMVLRG